MPSVITANAQHDISEQRKVCLATVIVVCNLPHLCRSGCRLPVEMWFPEAEAPSPGLTAALARLGATVRLLPRAAGHAGGFTMKAATILLSGFEKVTSVLVPPQLNANSIAKKCSFCAPPAARAIAPRVRPPSCSGASRRWVVHCSAFSEG